MFYLFINLYLFLGSLKEYWFGIIPNSSLLLFLALFWGVGGVVVLVWTDKASTTQETKQHTAYLPFK